MDEKKMLELLKRQMDEVTPPKSLEPEAIERKLLEAEAQQEREKKGTEAFEKKEETQAVKNPEGNAQRPKKRVRRFGYRTIAELGSLAAIFVLGVTVYSQSRQITQLKQQPAAAQELADQSAAPDETGKALTGQTAADAATGKNAAEEETARVPETQEPANTESAAAGETAALDKDTSSCQTVADAGDAASETEEVQTEAPEEALTYASGYEQIYDTLYSIFGSDSVLYEYELSAAAGARDMGATAEYAVEDAAVGSSGAVSEKNADYSRTNVQETDVDEGDIVKTDGTWIYILRQDGSFSIVRAEDGNTELESTTKLDLAGLSNAEVREMYLDGEQLAIVMDGMSTELQKDREVYRTATGYQTVLSVWDITDRSQPKQTGSMKQDGRYRDSRKNGRFVYLFTSYTPYLADSYEESTLVPRINGEAVAYDRFYLPERPANEDYLVISAINLTEPEQVTDQKVLVSGAENFYVSTENIYITNVNNSTESDVTVTEIVKFHYKNGTITGVAAGAVKGYLNDSFSMNEYDGMLRVVSTYYDEDWEEWNALYILDEKLQQLSAIEDLAKGETIRSARFFGTTGYFVTFRQTDPLFSVDLSDPKEPKVIGELKISGFSSYLHFYGENLLLGIGYEADEDTGTTTGLKLSMFDISDPSDVKEVDRIVLPGMTWCPSIEDYKSILVDPTKNLIGFYCDKRYFVYSYDTENGFTRELLCDFYSDDFAQPDGWDTEADEKTADIAATVDYDNMRGIYIGNALYLAGNNFVASYDMENGFELRQITGIE